jgi:uncharacterized protein (TIGR00369 family)
MTFAPRDPDFERRVRASFARQGVMRTLGAALARVAPGEVDLRFPFADALTQQHGLLHAGVTTTAVDTACGYAALSLMAPGADVVSVEFTVHLLAPARGAWFRAAGRVVRAGRTLTVVRGELRAFDAFDGDGAGGQADPRDADPRDASPGGAAVPAGGRVVAMLTGTMMAVRDRPEPAE